MTFLKGRSVLLVVFLFALFSISISILIPRNDQLQSTEEEFPRHILGSTDARVSIVGYFDLEASESREAWERLSNLREQYEDRVAIEFRHYPITAIHRHAMDAALALEAAGEQGKFWEFLNMLWSQQDAWQSVSAPLPLFVQYAERVGVTDTLRFRQQVIRQQFKDRILTDLHAANEAHASLDASMFINDQSVTMASVYLATERILSKPDGED